jgi:hypothetical protein
LRDGCSRLSAGHRTAYQGRLPHVDEGSVRLAGDIAQGGGCLPGSRTEAASALPAPGASSGPQPAC